ncbi:MAG TPA: amidase family protein [Gaiellaceae bacterium]
MDCVVVGAGAIGGTVGARLVRDGHQVLFCDADAEHVAAINADGLSIEGPLEQFTVRARAVLPDELPDRLQTVLLAVKTQDTAAAIEQIGPLLAEDGVVVSLQNGLNPPAIAQLIGAERTVGAFVNFGADYLAPGRIFVGGTGPLYLGELDGRPSARVEQLVRDLPDARSTDNILGYLWGKEAYGAMLFATAVSDLSIADALEEPRYRRLFVGLAEEVLAAAPLRPEAFDGFDPDDLEGSIDRLVAFNRRSAKTHSGIYRDLAVRRRRTEKAILADLDGPLLRRTLELIEEIEEGRRVCEVANLELLAAYARLQESAPALNAVIAELGPSERAAAGPLLGVSVAVKDNIDVHGTVTTNASTVGVPPPASRDAPVVARLRDAAAEILCKANLLEYAAGSVNPAFGMTYNPLDPGRTSGGSSSGSAALVAAGVCDHALGTDTGGSIRIPAAYCGIVGLKPTYGLVPVDGVCPLSATCDHVGTLTRTVEQAAVLLGVLAGRRFELGPVSGLRVGVLRRQLDDPDLMPGVRDRVTDAIEVLGAAGFDIVEIDVPELDLVGEALGAIVLREAWEVHRDLYAREADGYGPGTRALLELGAEVTEEAYRRGLADRDQVAAAFARAFDDVDVLAGPTVAYPAPPEDPPFGTPEGELEGRYTGPYNLAGVPAVSLPCGAVEGNLPAGLQLAAAVHREELLLSAARIYEEVGR